MMNIVTHPDPRLLKVCSPVEEKDLRHAQMLSARLQTVAQLKRAAGLAAPQIGALDRVIVVRIGKEFVTMINPEVIWLSPILEELNEGCLSIPGKRFPIERSISVDIKYRDQYFNEMLGYHDGLTARIIQHEIDHLDGKLINA